MWTLSKLTWQGLDVFSFNVWIFNQQVSKESRWIFKLECIFQVLVLKNGLGGFLNLMLWFDRERQNRCSGVVDRINPIMAILVGTIVQNLQLRADLAPQQEHLWEARYSNQNSDPNDMHSKDRKAGVFPIYLGYHLKVLLPCGLRNKGDKYEKSGTYLPATALWEFGRLRLKRYERLSVRRVFISQKSSEKGPRKRATEELSQIKW